MVIQVVLPGKFDARFAGILPFYTRWSSFLALADIHSSRIETDQTKTFPHKFNHINEDNTSSYTRIQVQVTTSAIEAEAPK